MTDQTPANTETALKMDGILPAIAAAMGDVQKVGKADRNKHDGYNFASIDNFLSLVNPICARHGLIIVSDEVSREDFTRKGRSGELPWMRVSFSFIVHHVSGQSLPSMTRSVEVMRNGAQAYGSAQSYCLKQFLRGLFLIPTGDKDDADLNPTDAGQIVRDAPQGPRPEAVDAATSSLGHADNLDALKAIFTDLPANIRRLPAVIAAKDARKAILEQPASQPASAGLDDEIPDFGG